jgi:hypothetical protein
MKNQTRKKRLTIAQQTARLRAANDRAEARLKVETAARSSLGKTWRDAFADGPKSSRNS